VIVLTALASAVVALAVRELVEWRYRVNDKRAACYHDFFETSFAGLITKHCSKCGYQEQKRDNDG